MTDRKIVYPGAGVQDTDITLNATWGRRAANWLARGTMGVSGVILGFETIASNGFNLTVGDGALVGPLTDEDTAMGSIADNSYVTTPIAVNSDFIAVGPFNTVQLSNGQSTIYLVSCAYQTTDTDNIPLYYESEDPDVVWRGVNNNGQPQPTTRQERVVFTVTPGSASANPQVPATPNGQIPVYTVQMFYGDGAVNIANVMRHPQAPFVPTTLPYAGASILAVLQGAGIVYSKADATQLIQALSIVGRRQGGYGSSQRGYVPAGVYRMRFKGWGGGGGGGAGNGGGGGGGAGAGMFDAWLPVLPNQPIDYVIGAGGGPAQAGGTTQVYINGVLVCVANGGGAGVQGSGNGVGAGSTTYGQSNSPGANPSGSSGSNGVGSSAVLIGGNGGAAPGFQGGNTQYVTAGNSATGNNGQLGSGGSGGCGNANGGNGGNGYVNTEY